MMQQQGNDGPQEAKTEYSAILDALIARARAGTNGASLASSAPFAAPSSTKFAPTAPDSTIMNALVQQELQRRALLSIPRLGNSDNELLESLLWQRSLSQQQVPLHLFPSNASGLGLPPTSTASLLNGGALSANGLMELVQQRQQQQPSQQLLQALAGLPPVTQAVPAVPEKRKGRTGTFPQKLYQMLFDLEKQEGGTDIASFLPHGRAFAIHDSKAFVASVMPKYFRMSRFSSFQRQLNLYEFGRVTEGPNKGSYYHELFVKGRPDLISTIKRNKIKSENLPSKGRGPFGPVDLSSRDAQLPPQLPTLPVAPVNESATNLSTAALLQTLANRGVL